MSSFDTKKALARNLITTVGLSALALISGLPKAHATTVVLGSDYWITEEGGAVFDFGGAIGEVSFKGVPIREFTPPDSSEIINVGLADTIVRRVNDVVFDDTSDFNESGVTNVEVVALSLISINPVDLGGALFDVRVTLDPTISSTGTLTINEDRTFFSDFTVNWLAEFIPEAGGDPIACPNPSGCNQPINLSGNGTWSDVFQGGPRVEGLVGDVNANVHTNLDSDQLDFYVAGLVEHDASGAGHHNVSAPEPLTIFGSATAAGLGAFFKRKIKKKGKTAAKG